MVVDSEPGTQFMKRVKSGQDERGVATQSYAAEFRDGQPRDDGDVAQNGALP